MIQGPKVCPHQLSTKATPRVMLGSGHLTSEGPLTLQEMFSIAHPSCTHLTLAPTIYGTPKRRQS